MRKPINCLFVPFGEVQDRDLLTKATAITRFDAELETQRWHASASVPTVSGATARGSRVSGEGCRLVKVDYSAACIGTGGTACLSW